MGKPFEITRPQNKDYIGHFLYKGTAPIFVTCKEVELGTLMARAQVAQQEGSACAETMLLRRLRVYRFQEKMDLPPGEILVECASCFANMVLQLGSPE